MILTDCILTERLVLRPFVEGDEYEWERRGEDFYTTASTDPVPSRDKAA